MAEDTKGVIRIGISKKNRYNGQRYQRGNQDPYIEEEQTTQSHDGDIVPYAFTLQ
jgi:hypothetical protein